MGVPKHVAIIPDGNRRWAKEKGLPIMEGHRRGSDVALKLLKKAKELDIKIMTFWALSTENWTRQKKQLDDLMRLFEQGISKNFNEVINNKIHFIHIGRKDRLSNYMKEKFAELEKRTKQFTDHYYVLALDYGGRDELLRAVRQVQNSKFKIQNLNNENFNQFLDTKDLPYPNVDLVIRTSGEMRTSGLMIWQAAYAEYIFHPKYFPDFTPQDFAECIDEYMKRQRRFGG